MVRRTAGAMAMVAFAVTCILGALEGCSLETGLSRALLAALAFFVLGLGIGWAGERLLREHLQALAKEDETEKPGGPAPQPPGGGGGEE